MVLQCKHLNFQNSIYYFKIKYWKSLLEEKIKLVSCFDYIYCTKWKLNVWQRFEFFSILFFSVSTWKKNQREDMNYMTTRIILLDKISKITRTYVYWHHILIHIFIGQLLRNLKFTIELILKFHSKLSLVE